LSLNGYILQQIKTFIDYKLFYIYNQHGICNKTAGENMTEKQFINKNKKEYIEFKLTNINTEIIEPFGELIKSALQISHGSYDNNFKVDKTKINTIAVVEDKHCYIDPDDLEFLFVRQFDENNQEYYTWSSDGGKYAQSNKLGKIRMHEYLMYPDLNKDSGCEINHMNGLTSINSMRNLVKVKISKEEDNYHGFFTKIMGNLKAAAEVYSQKLIDDNINRRIEVAVNNQQGQKPDTIKQKTEFTKDFVKKQLKDQKNNAVIKYSADYLNQNVISHIINEIPLDRDLFRSNKNYRESFNTDVLKKYTELMTKVADDLENNKELFSFSFEELEKCFNFEDFYTISSTASFCPQ
jgi:hypothetical protein